ncbi:MAG: AbrB/MazE/SpoVT family DNA-binding domain-containing protein [archaeon]
MKKKGLKCRCGFLARETKLNFLGYSIKGWKCGKCKEEYHDPEEAEKILLLNKLKKTEFEVKIGQIRSNLIVRIPREVQKALSLEKGEALVLRVSSNQKIELISS